MSKFFLATIVGLLAVFSCLAGNDQTSKSLVNTAEGNGSLNAATVPQVFGTIQDFVYTAKSDNLPRKVFFYIPKSATNKIREGSKLKTLLFLHGGGASTTTPAGAEEVARSYIADFSNYSEKSSVLLVFPTTSIGWNVHTRFFLSEFVESIQSILPSDRENILLSGHSMGAMGITREFPLIDSLFSGVVGLSAGTDPRYATDDVLMTYFNTPYVQINGLKDHFEDFEPRMRAVEANIHNLEKTFGKKSKFELIFHPGDHNYDRSLTEQTYDRIFKSPLNRSIREFYAVFEARNHPALVPALNQVSITESYWLKAKTFASPATKDASAQYVRTEFVHAKIKGQEILIDLKDPASPGEPLRIKTINLSLDSKLVDMSLPVTVIVNGKSVYNGVATPALEVPTRI